MKKRYRGMIPASMMLVVAIAIVAVGVTMGSDWDTIAKGVILGTVGASMLLFFIFEIRKDKITEEIGEFCYAKITDMRRSTGKDKDALQVSLDVYLKSSKKVVQYVEQAYLDEVKGCVPGDFLAIKYRTEDINIEFQVVDKSTLSDEVRIALGDKKAPDTKKEEEDKKENTYEYLDEFEDDQSIVIEEGYGFEIGKEKPLEIKEFSFAENDKFADWYKAHKRIEYQTWGKATFVTVILLILVVLVACLANIEL